MTLYVAVADLGEAPPPPLIFEPNRGPKGQKVFFWETAAPPSPRYLKV